MDMLNTLLASQGQESAMKQALYNVLAFVFVLGFAVAAIALYFILEPFLQPLLWALLFGSVLHPFKHTLAEYFRGCIGNLDTPVVLAVSASPFVFFHRFSNFFSRTAWKYRKLLIIVIALMAAKDLLPLSWLVRFIQIANILLGFTLNVLAVFSSPLAVGTLLAAYVITLIFRQSANVETVLALLSPIVYLALIRYILSVSGAFGIAVALGVLILVIIGFFADIEDKGKCGPKTSEKAVTKMHDQMTIFEIAVARKFKLWYLKLTDWFQSAGKELIEEEENCDSPSPPLITVDDIDSTEPPPPPEAETSESDLYIIVVAWACVIVHLYHNLHFLPLLYMPLLYSLSKGIFKCIINTDVTRNLQSSLASWFDERQAALQPPYLSGTIRLIAKGDRKLKLFLENSIDELTSVLVIILMFLVVISGAVFMAIKVYGESVYIIEITSSVINRTVVHNPELRELVPETINNAQEAIDGMLADAYSYGKDWIGKTLKSFVMEKDPVRAAALEKDIVELWDRIYAMYLTKQSGNVGQQAASMNFSWGTLLDGMKTLDVNRIFQEHYETLVTVIDSVWIILRSNVSILFSVMTALVSVVLGGGTAVLNFVISFIVFSTALFYLLIASNSSYKPIQILSSAIPNSKGKQISGLGKAIEQAVHGVFALSFRMAVFYGLYTWLIHSLFNVNIIFIPSALAAIFGAVPFLGTYWACFPALLEIWLINGNPFLALAMLVCQILPLCFVDSAIYSEIKGGGHPYLTGLAIAGGVFCMGVQGALFGPMLLCVMIAACNVYSKLVRKSNFNAVLQDLSSPISQPVPRMKKRASFSGQLVTENFS